MAKIIDGKKISTEIKEECKVKVAQLKEQGKEVCLAVIQVGDDTAYSIYVINKTNACEYVGMLSRTYKLPEETTQEELLKLVHELNQEDGVDGILVQLPLPAHINEDVVTQAISPQKDVDGFHNQNMGALTTGNEGFISCTPAGIIELLKRSDITIAGKNCVVVGRSNIVGKPMALLLLKENGTVTICHSHTQNLKEITKQADIFVAAIGKAKFFDESYIKDGAVVIDVGMHRDENNKLCGDVDFEKVEQKVSAITPVPGGVGPMTIAMLIYNCVKSAQNKWNKK
ncbi:MAG: bifunctional methylenetetrahydrofolate dehydrogenase/methenyltetrahydrofolate cyclohydrolase FolD [Clostridiales bacterium]|nr:bifunctional methylenetetrahydrofolate dehydrogenase/methenyltetrahydrofolate cyclohydrolase FolD [Clostridiales bacterium]